MAEKSNKEIVCPKCSQNTGFPEESEKAYCMHCGAEITRDMIKPKEKNISQNEIAKSMLLENFPDLLLKTDPEEAIKAFHRKYYEDYFFRFKNVHGETLKRISVVYENSEHVSMDLEQIAEALAVRAKQKIDETKRFKREKTLMDFNCIMAFYIFPAVFSNESPEDKVFVDALISKWNQQFPKVMLGSATFEEIKSGFKRKLFGIPIGF